MEELDVGQGGVEGEGRVRKPHSYGYSMPGLGRHIPLKPLLEWGETEAQSCPRSHNS